MEKNDKLKYKLDNHLLEIKYEVGNKTIQKVFITFKIQTL